MNLISRERKEKITEIALQSLFPTLKLTVSSPGQMTLHLRSWALPPVPDQSERRPRHMPFSWALPPVPDQSERRPTHMPLFYLSTV